MNVEAAVIEQVTGYKQQKRQADWLRLHGWKHIVNRLGEPVVSVAEYNRRMVGGRVALQEPNFAAING